ncbi:hypothetical protein, partial [Paraburkholderia gardini]|uniref:hypothetical protein n=1 Tax=Paraburkholderia gardini TaxID=2823469 RepID=UPI001E28CB59
ARYHPPPRWARAGGPPPRDAARDGGGWRRADLRGASINVSGAFGGTAKTAPQGQVSGFIRDLDVQARQAATR